MAFIAVFVLVASACDSTPSVAPGTPGAPGASAVAGASQGTVPGTESAAPGQTLAPGSEELIAAALEAGTITLEESLVYRALALFGSPELPEPYRSKFPDLDAATSLLADVDLHESELSAEALAKLEPYRLRPTDPKSIFNTTTTAAGTGHVVLAEAGAPGWHTDVVPGTSARIWIPDAIFLDASMALYKSIIRTVWEQLPGIFRYPNPDQPGTPAGGLNPDALIDFYFVNVGARDPRYDECTKVLKAEDCKLGFGEHGYAVAAEPRAGVTSSAYLVFDAAYDADDMYDTIAHELTHAGQFAYDRQESSWLKESTATWAAFRVLQKLEKDPAWEHGKVGAFFQGVDEPLPRRDGYESWVYFLFVSMQRGDSMIESIWQQAAEAGAQSEQAVDDRYPFAEHFGEFSLRNWNSDPVDPQYTKADPTFPTNVRPVPAKYQEIEGAAESPLDAGVAKLSMVYYRYEFADAVRRITFENGYAGLPDAHVWAIRKITGTWAEPQEWTADASRSFCRDIEDEDVTELILIVSNSSLTDPLQPPQPAKLSTKTTGCQGWAGTMTATKTWNYSDSGAAPFYIGKATSTFQGVWQADDTGLVRPMDSACSGSPSPCIVFVPTGTIAWTWKSTYPQGCSAETAGTLPAGGLDIRERQVFAMVRIDDSHLRYFGRGDTPAPAQQCNNPIDSGGNPPAFFQLHGDASSAIPVGKDGGTCFSTDWIIDASATTISGSCYAFNYPYHSLEFEWNLTRVGAAP